MAIILGDFNAKVGREKIFKPTTGNESLHKYSNDNGVRIVNFSTSKNLVVKSTMFPHRNIHKYVACSISIGPLVGKNTIIYFDVWNPNPLQSSLLGDAHFFQRSCHCWKHFSKASCEIMYSWAVAFRIMSSLDSNRVPFSGIFSLGNSQKSQGAMSGE